jgi:hypothetical protein
MNRNNFSRRKLEQNNLAILAMYRKPNKTVSFESSKSPKNYKSSTFIGEISRCNNCSSDLITRDQAIEKQNKFFRKKFSSHIYNGSKNRCKKQGFSAI